MSSNKLYHEIFREFESAGTRKDKVAVLQKYGDKRLQDFLLFSMHPSVKFDITKLPDYKPSVIPEGLDRKSTRLNSSHMSESRMPSSA